MRRKISTGRLLICILVSLIILLPLSWLVFSSVRTLPTFMASPFHFPETVEFNNYLHVWFEGNFGRYVLNSIMITGASLLLILIFSSLGAYGLLLLKSKIAKPILLLFVFGIGIPSQAILISIFMVEKTIHTYDSFYGIVLAYGGWATLSVFILLTFYRSIPSELIDSAKIDGCPDFRVLWNIIAPLSAPAISAVSIFYFVFIWNDLTYPLVLTSSERYYTVQLGLTKYQGMYSVDYPQITAALISASIVPVIFYLLFQKGFQEGLTLGALKG